MLAVFMYAEDTIAAVATPPGEGGIAVVRISGPDAERILDAIFRPTKGAQPRLQSHRLYHGLIRDPHANVVLDQVLVTIMRKPRSYTSETVAEVHCHGGAFLAREILRVVLSQGARYAEPGEFTKRAFLNGRIDLTQAEAVLDLIRARTRDGLSLAARQAEGGISKWIDAMRNGLLDCLVQVEAAIDFPEEDIELLQRDQLIEKITGFRDELHKIVATFEWGRLHREGARVCICGRPNVGKSSLLNALLGTQRAIVTAIPGTTRDVLEDSLNLDGIPVVLWDTAGLRETEDEIERIGVDLSRRHIERADVILLVLDGTQSLSGQEEEFLRERADGKVIVALNKSDLGLKLKRKTLESFSTAGISVTSAKDGSGIEELKHAIRSLLLTVNSEPPVVITNVRHKSALVRAEGALDNSLEALRRNQAAEFVAADLNEAKAALEEIVGAIPNEDILERIFSQFCIGK